MSTSLTFNFVTAAFITGCFMQSTVQAAPIVDPQSPATLAGRLDVSGNGKDWKLVFSDEFAGERLDASKWTSLLPWAGAEDSHWHNDQYASYITDEDVSVSGGQLRLATQKSAIQGKTRKFEYTEGMVHTGKTFRFVYGYVETSAKAPVEAGPGLWPAVWTLAEGWPPEFDIIEVWTGEPRIHQGYCFTKPGGGQGWNSYHEKIGPRGFHTYAMEWGPGYVFFLMDGKITKRVYGDLVTDKPQYLLINSGVCSGKGNMPPTPETKFPNSFDVDYCRVYARPDVVPFHNGGFEDDEHWPWTLSGGAKIENKDARSGKNVLHLGEGSETAEQKVFGLKPNTKYLLRGWAKSADVRRQPVRLGVKAFGGQELYQSVDQSTWKEFTQTFTTGASDTTAIVYCFNPDGPGGYFDDITLEPAT